MQERSKRKSLLAVINRSDGREFGERTRLARTRGARIDEHFWRDRAQERVTAFDHSYFLVRKLFRISIFVFPKASVVFFQFIQQLLLEALSCRFFDCAPLRCHRLLLRLSIFPRAVVDLARQMRNLWPLRADFPLVRFRVRVH